MKHETVLALARFTQLFPEAPAPEVRERGDVDYLMASDEISGESGLAVCKKLCPVWPEIEPVYARGGVCDCFNKMCDDKFPVVATVQGVEEFMAKCVALRLEK